MNEFFTARILVATGALVLTFAVPYVLAATGETFGQLSGVLNLGVDGVMLISGFAGYFVVLKSGSPWLGALTGIGVGMVMGLLIAVSNITLWAEQGISGIGFYLLGLGLSSLLFDKLVRTPTPIKSFPVLKIPVLADIPDIGKVFFRHDLVVYLAFLGIPVAAFILSRTTFGMNLRAVGENPEAADSVGVSVVRVRYAAQLINGALCGLAGAALAINLQIFQENLTAGLGFIAVALVYFGAWRPKWVMAGALLYGLVQAVVLQWKSLGIIHGSAADLAGTAPAVITILALVIVARRAQGPAALTKPFLRGA